MGREPEWDDPELTMLARRLREAHARVGALPRGARPRLTRHLLVITDVAKRDPATAVQRLDAFMEELNEAENPS